MKTLIIYSIIIGLLCPIQSYTQPNFGKTWLIGFVGYQIKFTGSNIIHDTTILSQINPSGFFEGTSNICDSSGNSRYLSNGFNIWHSDGSFVEGGDSLVPHDFYSYQPSGAYQPQSSIFLPFEGGITYFVTPTVNDTELYNILNVYQDGKATFNLLLYNKIDDQANNGLGKVIQRMVPILENKPLAKTQMMACKHGNGKDWWLFKMAGDANKVYKFLFSKDSVVYRGEQSFPYPFRGYWDLNGQMMFSQDGTKFATTFSTEHIGYGEVFVADFDRCQGDLKNIQRIFIPEQITPIPGGNFIDSVNSGLCFSSNNRFLYVSKFGAVMQYDLTDGSVYKVCSTDTSVSSFAGYSHLYLGPDNNLYIGNKDGISRQMSKINNPDVEGIGCNFCRKCLRSQSYSGYLRLPPCMPNYELGADPNNPNCWPVGIAEANGKKKGIKVFPNPTKQKINFEFNFDDSREGLIQIIDLYGRKRISISVSDNTFLLQMDISKLEPGTYFYRYYRQGKETITDKIMVE